MAQGPGVTVIERARAVQARLKEVRADTHIAAIALKSFLSLIPLIVVAIAVLGFVAAGDADLTDRIIDNLKLEGGLADTLTENVGAAEDSRKAASVVGVLSLAWTGLGLFAVIAQACNAVWQVPARGTKDKLAGVVWIVGAIVLFAAIGAGVAIIQFVNLPFLGLLTSFAIGFVAGTGLFWWTQFVFTNVKVPARTFLPGALVGGVALAAFQILGSYLVPQLLESASALYASLASVVALLSFLLIIARLLVLSSVVSVVWWEAGHGTVDLMVRAPALPGGAWAVAERAGQRPKPVRPSKLVAAVKARFAKGH